jgi:phosphate/sulfate permease
MISDLTIIYGVLGFLLASYSVIANDSAQTLGTFIASNRETKWYWQWLVMSSVLVATLTYGYMSGDIAHGRLNHIPLPEQFQWYHLAAPALLMALTRFGVPVSTTILTLSVFSTGFVLEKILLKSAMGYAVAAVAAYALWAVLSKLLDEKAPVSEENKKKWRVAQWIATCLLWHQWLAHDIANVAVFLPRGEALPLWMFISFVVILVVGLSLLFYNRGGKIQEIVLSKSGTRFMRSATIIDLVYALVLWYFKQYNDIPMSTTWVFVGLLCGRELAVYRKFNPEGRGPRVIFPMLLSDFMKMMLGLALSIILVWAIDSF